MSRPKNFQSPRPQSVQRSLFEFQEDGVDGNNKQLECHLWARDLQTLLNDEVGCSLFEQYLTEEKCDMSELYFVYACNGLRLEEEPSERDRCARVIYRHYVKGDLIRAISEDVRNTLKDRIDRKEIVPDVFDDAVRQVKENIMRTTFVKFIQSDTYIAHVQRMASEGVVDMLPPIDNDQNDDLDASRSSAPAPSDSEDDHMYPMVLNANNNYEDAGSGDSDNVTSTNDNNNDSFFANQMPTLQEDEELKNSTFPPPRPLAGGKCAPEMVPPPRPPQSRMIRLQKRQSQIGLKYIEKIGKADFRPPPNPYHVKSSYFVPPSAYNSDIQSMSSGNYTDLDTMNNDGTRSENFRRHSSETERRKGPRKYVNVRDSLNHTVIPRTIFSVGSDGKDLILDPSRTLVSTNPREFHKQVCDKLKLFLGEVTEDELQNQSILDKHVDRVFKTPPAQSPRHTSPPLERHLFGRTGHKSPYHSNSGFFRSTNNVRREDTDNNGAYSCLANMNIASGAPQIQPRVRTYSGAEPNGPDNILGFPAFNPHENVREWFNRSSHEPSTSKSKNKASVCSSSNRSSKSGQENKKKSLTPNKETDVVVGYQYEGESVPFVTRLPVKHLRLKEFKAHLTKKGNFRYFFKCSMDGFGSEGVYEELKDDNQILPLWEGKVFSQIVPVDLNTAAKTAQDTSPSEVRKESM